jgi:drug/metabolite transporter (DMT)-like permease
MAVIWGIPYLLIKVAVGELSPVTLVVLRTSIGALLLLPVAAARGSLAPVFRHWRWLIAFSLAEVAVPWLLLSHAETRLSSSLSGLLIATVPLFAALIGVILGGDDRLDTRRLAGLGVGFLGVSLLLGLDFSSVSLLAVVEVGLTAAGYAIGPMIIARRLSTAPALGVVAASLGLTAVVYAPFALSRLPAAMPSTQVIAAVAILGVVCTALAFLLFFALIAEVGPVRAPVFTYVNPAVALAVGVAVLGERVTLGAVVGFPLILLGMFLATQRRRRSGARSELGERARARTAA